MVGGMSPWRLGCKASRILNLKFVDVMVQLTPSSKGFNMGGTPKIVLPQNGWFIMESLINMDDLGVPLFSETAI